MAATILYGIRNCDTVRAARAWLAARHVAYDFHDYKTAGIDRGRLERWCKERGWETLFNRAGTTFRKLPDGDKRDLNQAKALALMVAHPSIIKRPVLEWSGPLLVGFTPESYARLLTP
ncbi:MAG: arsenate reductase [Rhodospirillaceae bacterium]|nr:MAG: arsenate reductase [Rhodospirillaceae bacterium]